MKKLGLENCGIKNWDGTLLYLTQVMELTKMDKDTTQKVLIDLPTYLT